VSTRRLGDCHASRRVDTRGYRCAIGRDGRLYIAFEAAGGNHLFRYSPTDINEPFKLVGGATLAFGGQGPEQDQPMHIHRPLQDKRFGKDGFIATATLK